MLPQVGISGWRLVTGVFKVRIQTPSVLNNNQNVLCSRGKKGADREGEDWRGGGGVGCGSRQRCSALVAGLLRITLPWTPVIDLLSMVITGLLETACFKSIL